MIIVETPIGADDTRQRWDGASVHAFEGTYGDCPSTRALMTVARRALMVY